MNPVVLRMRIVVVVTMIVAVWLGTKIAQTEFFWPALAAGSLGAIALTQLQPLSIGTLLLGAAVFGYIVGNRGFAQISVTGDIPLLPAEFVLLVAGGILLVQSALRRVIPVRRDLLNLSILVWIVLSSIRLYPDMKIFGVMALRDYATVYYAAFFFLAQKAGASVNERRFLNGCLLAGGVALLLVYPVYAQFPEFFLDHLLFRGTPIIYIKGDLLGTFLAAGSVLAFARFEMGKSRIALVLSLLMAAATMTTNNRASMLGLIVPATILAVGRRPRFLATLSVSALAAIVVLFLAAQVQGQRWENTPLHDMYERVVSLTDPYGENTYSGEETSVKGDNNVFRSTWWEIIIDETMHTNPWFGLGWGYDLGEQFAQIYYPEGGEDFSARSPHNVLVTIFARTGTVGLLSFLGVLLASAIRMWRAIKSNDESIGLWCAACTIFTSACFGVVLEGPMGAVLFWTVLGLANSSVSANTASSQAADGSPEPKNTLRDWPVAKAQSFDIQSGNT
jgi:O-antigen ligase